MYFSIQKFGVSKILITNVSCHDNSQRVQHGNVQDNVNVFDLRRVDRSYAAASAAEQVPRLATANTATDMLL